MDKLTLDIDHRGEAARAAVNHGLMNNFDTLAGAIQNGRDESLTEYLPQDIPGYYSYARQFTLDDRFFSTVMGPSFPNHLVTVAATSVNTIDNPINNSNHAWGCDSGPFSRVTAINPHTKKPHQVRPCFNIPTLPDSLNKHHVS
jgi:phospholipase C